MKKNISRIIERIIVNILPPIMSLIIAIVVPFPEFSADRWFNITTVLVEVIGIILGFMVAVVSILLAFNGSKMIDLFKQTGHFKDILLTYMTCCFHLLISLFIILVIILLDAEGILYFKLALGLLIDSMLFVGVCLLYLYGLIRKMDF